MQVEVIVALIVSGSALIGSVINSVIIFKNSAKVLKQSKYQIEYNRLNERKKYILKKLNEFYYPLRNYLQTSKSLYDLFIQGKPNGFRTLTYLLNPNQSYEDNVKVVLQGNDKILLEKIFEIGFEIEKLIAVKGGIIDDPEFTEKYTPSNAFADPMIVGNLSLLSLTKSHLNFIRLAYNGNLIGDVEKFTVYVYPRELNKILDKIILELEESREKYEADMANLTQ